MEKFQEFRDFAKKRCDIANHILTQTCPLVQDPRLLIAVVENLFLSHTKAIGSLLYYERSFKRIPPFRDNFSSKLIMLKEYCVRKYRINPEYLNMIEDISNIIIAHKKSPMEFSRKNGFVICSDNYNMKHITADLLKGYITKTKLFLEQINRIIENGRIS